ncbi:hypothetical protein U9M48_030675 [Paspalum notatum var. saurae]|uniref:DUF4220 domain-containing protein n=1 Tax=Paspalum notatum var. saurae TaxID=547442 RepID=A0AAQ3U1F3_PASNO
MHAERIKQAEVCGREIKRWNEWGIRSLVLLSFAFQVLLLILAEFRRRIGSSVMRLSVWSAYMLDNAKAIYAPGHMSVTSRSAEYQLMAFWAPLHLLYLGRQDNTTAYTPSRTTGCGCAIFRRSPCRWPQPATFSTSPPSSAMPPLRVLMSLVGAAKYGERVWALMSAVSNPITGKNYRNLQPSTAAIQTGYYLDALISMGPSWDAEAYLLMAHRMLDVPMDLMRGPLGQDYTVYPFASNLCGEDLYLVVEMQLSLMHVVFYTLCVHALTAAATASAFLLFHFHLRPAGHRTQQGPYSRVDVAITYVLLAGAVVVEAMSLLRATLSSWTCPLLGRRSRDKYWIEEHTLLNRIARALTSLRRLVHAADWRRRYWSGSMGQHNLLRLGARSRASSISKIARWMGLEDRWNIMAYSSRLPVPSLIKDLLVKQVLKGDGVSGDGVEEAAGRSNNNSELPEDARYARLFDSRGRAELKRWGLYDGDIVYSLTWSLDERILVWHIATNIFLSWWRSEKKQHTTNKDDKAEVVEALSNYMVFLLATDPYMLSPAASRSSYIEVCYGLTTKGPRYGSAEELAGVLRSYGEGLLEAAATGSTDNLHIRYGFRLDFSTQQHLRLMLQTGCKLGAKLISSEVELQDTAAAGTLEVVAQVWVEMLCYAAEQCSADSHAKQLSNGGELITVAALLLKYLKKRHFPTAGTRFNPQRWHRGGPFGSPPPDENKNNPFSRAFP